MIDIHTHTLHSDGADTVQQLLCHAQELGLTHLSITDHNTVSAYRDPAMEHWQELYHGTLLRGIEITCMYKGEIVEVLGYGYDLDKLEALLPGLVLPFREKQLREAKLIANAFQKAGVRFDPRNIVFDPDHESARKAFLAELKRYPENLCLVTDPASLERSSAFTRKEIYNPLSPLYVDESSLYPTLQQASDAIHAAGGISLLAHLYIYAHAAEFRTELDDIVAWAKLDGVECAHSEFTVEQIADLEQYTAEKGLLRSGGSDYHGTRKPKISMGSGQGQLCIPESYLENWPEQIQATFTASSAHSSDAAESPSL